MLVDDDAHYRQTLVSLLSTEDDIVVVGEASNGREALHLALEMTPDVIVMDLRMPYEGGVSATAAVRRTVPEARILVLTVSDAEVDLYRSIDAGASGYLVKDTSTGDIAEALRVVARGDAILSPDMTAHVLPKLPALRTSREPKADTGGLTDRELDVLRLVAAGHSNREIAHKLHVSHHTVKRHMGNILTRLHARSRVEAAMYAARAGLIGEEAE